MTKHNNGLRRREFLVGSATAGAGLMFGFSLGTKLPVEPVKLLQQEILTMGYS